MRKFARYFCLIKSVLHMSCCNWCIGQWSCGLGSKSVNYVTEAGKKEGEKLNLPEVVSLAIRFAVPYKTRACFVQIGVAVTTLETGRMPL